MSNSSGRLDSIWRFPIKSFQGESIERTVLSESGVFADRTFALRCVESGKVVSGKHAKLGERILEFAARYVEPHPRDPVGGLPWVLTDSFAVSS